MSTLSTLVGQEQYRRLQSLALPISTVEDLLSRDTVRTANDLRISIQEFENLKLRVTKAVLQIPGAQEHSIFAWKALPAAIPDITAESYGIRPTGIIELDAMLNGGVPASSLVSIIGATGCGKTHVVASCATTCALLGMKVLVISTTNDITIKRLQALMELSIRQNQKSTQPLSIVQMQELLIFSLSNLYVQHCYDLWTLLDLLGNVKDHNQFGLILIDSLHHLVSPLLSSTAAASSTGNALSRTTSAYNASSTSATGSSTATSATPAVVAEYLNSLLAQAGLLLRSLTSQHSSVIVTNTPIETAGLQRKGTLHRTSSIANNASYNAMSSASAANNDGVVSGTGMQNALLDMVDVNITLDRVAYDRSNSMRDLLSSGVHANAGAAGAGGGPAATPTVIKAAVVLRPAYLKAHPASCDFRISL